MKKVILACLVLTLVTTSMLALNVDSVAAITSAEREACVDDCIATHSAFSLGRILCVSRCWLRYLEERIVGVSAAPPEFEDPQVQRICETEGEFLAIDGTTTIVVTPMAGYNMNIESVRFEYKLNLGPYTLIGIDADGSDGWSMTWDVTGLPPDNYILLVTNIDDVGDESGCPISALVNGFTVDCPPVPVFPSWYALAAAVAAAGGLGYLIWRRLLKRA